MSVNALRILIVDDNLEDRLHVKAALLKGSSNRFHFTEAASCAEGLRMIQRDNAAGFNCVILDFELPDGVATDLLDALRSSELLARVPVLVLTGSETERNKVVLRSGAQEYLGKGWLTPASISRAVENAIDRHAIAARMAENHARLKESEEFSRTIIESSPDCVKVLDLQANILQLNPLGVALLELDDFAAIQNQSWPGLWPTDSQAMVQEAVQRARGGEAARFQGLCRTAKGNPKWWDVIVTPIKNAEGTVGRLLAVSRDITSIKRSEEYLRESERRFRNLADNAPVIVWVSEPSGQCSYLNQAWSDFTGLPNTNTESFFDAISPIDRQHFLDELTRASSEKNRFGCTYRLRRQDGEYVWVLSVASARFADLQFLGHVGTIIDITDQKHLEELVSERTTKLQETIGELEAVSYSISHDMRQPLRSMQQFSQILLEEYDAKLDAEGRSYLTRIIAAANRLDRLILDVLTYSRVSRAELVCGPVDTQQLVSDIIAQYAFLHSAHVKVSIRGKLLPVLAVQSLMTQIISNLLGNAIKFVPPDRAGLVEIWTEPSSSGVRICVEDNGIGIAPENRIRIWRIFEQIPNGLEREGTGIGLSIVKKAVERLGGRFGVDSEPGKGSRFWVELRSPELQRENETHPAG